MIEATTPARTGGNGEARMSNETEIVNAEIEQASIRFDRGTFLSAWVFVDYGGSQQGFGGYVIGGDPDSDSPCSRHADQPNLAAEFIANVMSVAGVSDWSSLKGRVIRVERIKGFGPITAIGHATKDRWFRPDQSEAFKRAVAQQA